MNFCRNCGASLAPVSVGSDAARARASIAAHSGLPPGPGTPAAPPEPAVVTGAAPGHAGGPGGAAAQPGGPGSAVRAPRRSCPHCGAKTPVGFSFCQHCGKYLPSVSEAVRTGAVISGETGGVDEPPGPAPAQADLASPARLDGGASPAARAPTPPGGVPPVIVAHPAPVAVRAPLAREPLADAPLGEAPRAAARSDDPGAGDPGAGAHDVGAHGDPSRREPLLQAPISGAHDAGEQGGDSRGASHPSRRPAQILPAMAVQAPEPGPPSEPALDAPAAPVPDPSIEPSGAPPWGALVALNPDGSEGMRHSLRGEWVEIGRTLGDIRFVDDRFLAHVHARLEHGDGRVHIVPLDGLNGVYRRLREPTAVGDGATLLLGREVLRFELVDEDERNAQPLVRHGVALFGSPPRAPWGRLGQVLATGGIQDVRHLWAPVVTVGREEGELVFRDDVFLSRQHAAFSWRDGQCIVEDLGSANGTFLRLSGRTELRAGDFLRMGDQLFCLEIASTS